MRYPSVAGLFYPSDKKTLLKQIEECFLSELGPKELPKRGEEESNIVGAIVPHAGYVYSGYEAAYVYHELAKYKKPSTIIILSPNHYGIGSSIATSKENWLTPLGEVEIDSKAVEYLWRNCEILDVDEKAHIREHSIEVQLPFLQYIYGEFKFVPICLRMQDLETCRELAECLSNFALNFASPQNLLIIASSDFSHYVSEDYAKKVDFKAIEHILALDEEKFIREVYERNISICGYGAIATCIAVVKKLGATKGELLKYGTSGDVTGDRSQVVAYAGIVFRR